MFEVGPQPTLRLNGISGGQKKSSQILLGPALNACHSDSPLGIERLAHIPRDPFSFREHDPIFFDGVYRIFRQIVPQLRQAPFESSRLATQDGVDDVRQMRVGEGVTGRIHDTVHDPWFGKADFCSQSANVFGRRDSDGG
jgi:hypothetical protein